MIMIKKIAIILFSVGLAASGIFGFNKLNYWERSAWIFNLKTMERRFEGRGRGGHDEFDRRSRENPDSTFRMRPDAEFGGRPGGEFRERTDGEFRERSDGEFRERTDGEFRERSEGRASFGPGDRGRGGHGRGDSHGGKKVRLRNVIWFLAVFSAFTVVSVYLDRAWMRLRKKKTPSLP
jgi:hypothetical protein